MGNNVVAILQHISGTFRGDGDCVYVVGDRVYHFEDAQLNPWTQIWMENGVFGTTYIGDAEHGDEVGDDIADLMHHQNISAGTVYHRLGDLGEIGRFTDALIAEKDEVREKHQDYMAMLNEVGQRYRDAVADIQTVMVRIERKQASLDSVSYLDAVRELNECSEAFKALVTSIAAVEFTK